MKFTSNYIQLSEVKLHYIKEGNGNKLVVLLHGWPEFWYSWRLQIPALAEAGFTVVAPDLRGFNLSDKPKGVDQYTMDKVGKDIYELVVKLGFDKAYIVGHDWGGAVAWHIALHYPNLVEKLAVLNCPHPGIFIKNLTSNPAQLLKSWYMLFFQIPFIPEFFISNNLKNFFIKAFRDWSYNKSVFSDEHIGRYVMAYSEPDAVTTSINYYRAGLRLSAKGVSKQSRKVQAPTLMIWGENDRALGKELTEGTEKYIDNTFDLKFIPQCSHWVQQDASTEVNDYLISFFNK